MIKLVVSDMDGTLFGPDTVLSQEVIREVQALKERGVLFTIASGRAEWFIQPYAEQLELTCPYIACNGSTVTDGTRTLLRLQFPIFPLRKVLDFAEEQGLSIMYTIEGRERIAQVSALTLPDDRSSPYDGVFPLHEEEWDALQVEKIMVYDPANSGIIVRIDEMLRSLDASVHVVRYGLRAVEVSEKSATKASGIACLLEHLNLVPGQVLAIGDDENDVEMFQYAGTSAAVANATENARAAAGYLCRKTQGQGVIEAIRRFCPGGAQ